LKNLIVPDILFIQSLCRLGGKVTGLDANENSISIAKEHKKSDEFLNNRL
jgi:2-polyprenyl-3-methyl-5-hydroxy-6-metoxy-1,4-benzoquinol methylase